MFGNLFNPVGSHTTDGTISAATDLTKPSGANALILQATGQAVRYTLDGTTPTASTGFRLAANERVELAIGSGVSVVKVIEETGSAAVQWLWGVLLPIPGAKAGRT